MSEFLTAAAEALGVPESLVERSAAARAAESGESVESILAAWAGGEALQALSAPSEPATPTAESEAEPVAETPSEPVAATPAMIEPVSAEPVATTRSPAPTEVTPAQAANLSEVVTVPTAGIRERTNFRLPRWLTALMLLIPAFGLFSLGGSATGACGEATELQTDVVTGDIVNCDGTEFTGSGIEGGTTDYIAAGGEIYVASCSGCHGASGAGGGPFPALNGVLNTFGACTDHLTWVRLGSLGTQAEGRNTYGDTNKPISGGMPSFSSLTEEQLASVVAFERVRFGGGNSDEVITDCGLGSPDGEDGEAPTEGEPPAEGETPTTGEASTARHG